MRKLLLLVLLLAVIAAALWFGGAGRSTPATATADGTPEGARFDFELQGVQLRQLDARGQLRYEVLAERIVQLPDGGALQATELILNHDPPGTVEGSDRRVVLTAAEGEMPASGDLVRLAGNVTAEGRPADSSWPLRLETPGLEYDLADQQATAPGDVVLTRCQSRVQGRGLHANFAAGTLTLESSVHGTYLPCSP